MNAIDDLFSTVGVTWGLRGDPYLWGAIKQQVTLDGVPESVVAFEAMILQTFADITGVNMTSADNVFVESFDQGGMSSGLISGKFWRESGVPVLLDRYRSAR